VIDAELPLRFSRQKVRIEHVRPVRLRSALKRSKRILIIASHAAVLGATRPVPVAEDARPHPLGGYTWIPRLEKEILDSRAMQTIAILPA
jgi:hypothetical protein